MSKSEALQQFGFNPERPVIAVIGGSQGSQTLNTIVMGSLDYLTTTLDTQVIWQTGIAHYDSLKHFETEYPSLKQFPFIEQMGTVYSAADLVISRAGALALAEIAYCGKPSLLVPFPAAAADHQTKNAKSLAEAGAAVMLVESELSPERFEKEVGNLISDRERLEQMRKAAKSVSVPDAADKIVNEILTLLDN